MNKPTIKKITIHPREQLTEKAKAAISQYAIHKSKKKQRGLNIHWFMVDYVLEAERMPRERLYRQLITWGYVWSPCTGFWYTKKIKEE
jgi:hypothetical protein